MISRLYNFELKDYIVTKLNITKYLVDRQKKVKMRDEKIDSFSL